MLSSVMTIQTNFDFVVAVLVAVVDVVAVDNDDE